VSGWRAVRADDFEGRRKLIAHELGARAIKLNRFAGAVVPSTA
jgi:hypothetical protein